MLTGASLSSQSAQPKKPMARRPVNAFVNVKAQQGTTSNHKPPQVSGSETSSDLQSRQSATNDHKPCRSLGVKRSRVQIPAARPKGAGQSACASEVSLARLAIPAKSTRDAWLGAPSTSPRAAARAPSRSSATARVVGSVRIDGPRRTSIADCHRSEPEPLSFPRRFRVRRLIRTR
jgi:hypothetical protein